MRLIYVLTLVMTVMAQFKGSLLNAVDKWVLGNPAVKQTLKSQSSVNKGELKLLKWLSNSNADLNALGLNGMDKVFNMAFK